MRTTPAGDASRSLIAANYDTPLTDGDGDMLTCAHCNTCQPANEFEDGLRCKHCAEKQDA